MIKDVSTNYPGWTVTAYKNEDIPCEGAYLASYIDDVNALYRDSKTDAKYMERQLSYQNGNRRNKKMYTKQELGPDHTYYLIRLLPPSNELGEISP